MPDQLYQRIYLSPHLDDAVLSCGGRIYRQRQAGLSVLVVTVMAGDPPAGARESNLARELHARWELETDPTAVRRAEDREALSILDAETLHWEWPDCIYRRHGESGEFLYRSESALFAPLHPAERPLVGALVRRLAELPLAAGAQVSAPLTVGGHVDHRLVRQAAEMWRPLPGELLYYEDYPYAEDPKALDEALGDGGGWQAEIETLSPRAMAAKIAAVARYRSQISTFFDGEDEMASRLRAYAARVGGGEKWAERYWRRRL